MLKKAEQIIYFVPGISICQLYLLVYMYTRKNQMTTVSDVITLTKGETLNFKFHLFINLLVIINVYVETKIHDNNFLNTIFDDTETSKIIRQKIGNDWDMGNDSSIVFEVLNMLSLATTMSYNLVTNNKMQSKYHYISAATFFLSATIVNFSIVRQKKKKKINDELQTNIYRVQKITNISHLICFSTIAILFIAMRIKKLEKYRGKITKVFGYMELLFLTTTVVFKYSRLMMYYTVKEDVYDAQMMLKFCADNNVELSEKG